MSVHDGHRQRMRDRFMKNGLDSFNDHEILEMLLYYTIPRMDTNEIAHRLMDRFGSFVQVIEAPPRELEKVPGVGKNTATFLSLLKQTHRHLNVCKAKENTVLASIDDCGVYLRSFFCGISNEVVYLLCMDSKAMVIDCYLVSEGGVTSANLSIRKIMDIAISSNAASVVLAHNHPGGFALPSADDVITTKRLAKALYLADVILVDHVIVAGNDFVSMCQSGMYEPGSISVDD